MRQRATAVAPFQIAWTVVVRRALRSRSGLRQVTLDEFLAGRREGKSPATLAVLVAGAGLLGNRVAFSCEGPTVCAPARASDAPGCAARAMARSSSDTGMASSPSLPGSLTRRGGSACRHSAHLRQPAPVTVRRGRERRGRGGTCTGARGLSFARRVLVGHDFLRRRAAGWTLGAVAVGASSHADRGGPASRRGTGGWDVRGASGRVMRGRRSAGRSGVRARRPCVRRCSRRCHDTGWGDALRDRESVLKAGTAPCYAA